MVQVPNTHILTQNLYDYNYYYPKPKHLLIGYLDPPGGILLFFKVNSLIRDTGLSGRDR